ncbi:hypothetical protein Ndes2526A_g01216 [Nannochloris sp. 'desiccata']
MLVTVSPGSPICSSLCLRSCTRGAALNGSTDWLGTATGDRWQSAAPAGYVFPFGVPLLGTVSSSTIPLQSLHAYSRDALATGVHGRRSVLLPARATPQQLLLGSYNSAAIRTLAVSTDQHRRRTEALQEFSAWYCLNMPMLGVLRPPQHALPEEILVYYQLHWLPRHGETLLQGQLWAVPSTLENNCSLSIAFVYAGRTGLYSSEACTGNPMHSRALTEFKKGYARRLPDYGCAPILPLPNIRTLHRDVPNTLTLHLYPSYNTRNLLAYF